jgi:hypothetical protein
MSHNDPNVFKKCIACRSVTHRVNDPISTCVQHLGRIKHGLVYGLCKKALFRLLIVNETEEANKKDEIRAHEKMFMTEVVQSWFP